MPERMVTDEHVVKEPRQISVTIGGEKSPVILQKEKIITTPPVEVKKVIIKKEAETPVREVVVESRPKQDKEISVHIGIGAVQTVVEVKKEEVSEVQEVPLKKGYFKKMKKLK